MAHCHCSVTLGSQHNTPYMHTQPGDVPSCSSLENDDPPPQFEPRMDGTWLRDYVQCGRHLAIHMPGDGRSGYSQISYSWVGTRLSRGWVMGMSISFDPDYNSEHLGSPDAGFLIARVLSWRFREIAGIIVRQIKHIIIRSRDPTAESKVLVSHMCRFQSMSE